MGKDSVQISAAATLLADAHRHVQDPLTKSRAGAGSAGVHRECGLGSWVGVTSEGLRASAARQLRTPPEPRQMGCVTIGRQKADMGTATNLS